MPALRVAIPAITPSRRRALLVLGVVVAAVVWGLVLYLAEPYDWSTVGTGHDARPYWATTLEFPMQRPESAPTTPTCTRPPSCN